MNKVLIYSINTQKKINGDLIIYSLQNLFNIIPKIQQNKVAIKLQILLRSIYLSKTAKINLQKYLWSITHIKEIQQFLKKENKKIFKNNKTKRKNNFGIWLQKTLLSQSEWKCKFNQKLIYNLQIKKTYSRNFSKN